MQGDREESETGRWVFMDVLPRVHYWAGMAKKMGLSLLPDTISPWKGQTDGLFNPPTQAHL